MMVQFFDTKITNYEELSEPMATEELRKMAQDEKSFHYIGLILYPGIKLFGTMLEQTFFPPDTPANDKLQMTIINLLDFVWVIYSIPKDKYHQAEIIAKKTGLKIVKGPPQVISQNPSDKFPINSKAFFTLLLISKHPIYFDGYDQNKLSKVESELIEQISSGKIGPFVDYLTEVRKSQH